ncbi:hypothetical protein A3C09_01810 [Candidatus Uhrbacteria bacterium RIFCSPHIGHO2_02_FULL_47_44]|uniref:Cation-transporting P-type ATPase N-terminal domain-containing protein n=1 Tax=Candidatus Uhrbacteria bacterium RIFCSPLOWO2_02_FULL_48_18 TaxID=1802408 RepID=A0A1F7V996_9BACT|nr:MAG: hypothetical protein A3C09_01810 [Candidatus Uhrbacteria bacterium RIFCSPHIGHO2_02_FULL_47_44]OGL76189.1 MAG: hypothetical protein A3E97_03090 [Candidatus Uhrbacteria bacterium RIFCSPHIGHO2_12_FULL_47_12]OGL81890.1 MAG: hypothetical protein A3B20_02265 [Candidatus Uhrbacteria bacterium RIFCSPLOWO2_01_FULL_47_17]OGL87053.1 MAG: hypothetical protein A3I41_03855 [Candidatus Uhrbacteria bacterium RIFCSPLOWO2_02_FULL_48_18]OGL92733.1 MAG: hypothetical protein A3H12_03640 [Candidatus Uhrbacte
MSTHQPLWHTLPAAQILDELHSSRDGLSPSKVLSQRAKFGLNELPKEKPLAWWALLMHQFLSPFILILVVAILLSALLGDIVDTLVILAAVLLNTLIGFVQEYKANRALLSLQALVQPIAEVRRDDSVQVVKAHELVPGDVLLLRTGDKVIADARLLEVIDLQINEATLTGESMPILKQLKELPPGAIVSDRTNMVFAGTHVVAGHATAIVVATGVQTEFGKIAELLSQTEEGQTPLQKELAQFARRMALLVLGIIVVLFGVGLLVGKDVIEMFGLGVALAVAAIPEGLLVSVTIILALGMQRILKRRSLTRRLVAAETLGSVSVICSDKTGTITQGDMRVVSVFTLDETFSFESLPDVTEGPLKKLFDVVTLCNDAEVIEHPGGEIEIKGNSTDRALLLAAQSIGLGISAKRQMHERIGEIPFDSSRKFMVTRHAWDHETRLLLKGAPERILSFLSYVIVGKKMVHFTDHEKQLFEKQIQAMTAQGLRVVALAYRDTTKDERSVGEGDLHSFVFLGFLGLRDPIRKEAHAQILAAKKAGVKTVIVTGDHPETARMIGKEAGIITGEDGVVTGLQLDAWSDDELQKKIEHIHIFARVEPRHKIRIIQAFQAHDEVVAMTGDGVNDAPALKAADVGVALGSGTEVARQAADLVLLDNDLGTITAAIEEGRVIFDNIRKVTVYLVAGSFTELILIAASLLLGLPLPLLPAQILWINMVADSFPSVGLTLEPGEKDVMTLSPRSRKEPILGREMIKLIALIAVITNSVLFGIFLWLLHLGMEVSHVQTFLFAAVGMDTLFYVFAMKSLRRSLFRVNPFSNMWLTLSVLFGFFLMWLAVHVPFLQSLFETSALSLSEWGFIFMMGIMKLILIELGKEFLFYKRSLHKPV